MKNKFVALLIAIIFPVAFFLVFDHFDTWKVLGRKNQPKLKRYIPLTDTNASSTGHQANDTVWHTIPDFSFLAHTNKTITQAKFKDKIYVADFFFTNCPGICPKMSTQLARVQDEFRADKDILLLSHTVDPARDTVATLAQYASLYEADSSKWFFVTGDKKVLYEQARKGYFITATEGDGGEDDFVHSEKLVLVDKSGVIRGYYDGTKEAEVNQLMIDIKVLQLEYPREKRKKIELRRGEQK